VVARFLGAFLTGVALLVMFPASSFAQSQFPAVGNLDCNGFSAIQKPLRLVDACTDLRGLNGQRAEDNGHYIGHDEPSIGFYSSTPGSGNNMQWEFTLPVERPLPATQSFENFITFWFGLALCDPGSFPNGPCIPDSDANDPNAAGSAFLEMQFYPPGNPPFITQISCDLTHWCASLHINSLEVMSNGGLNPKCAETTNFAFIQTNGVPTGPAGPVSATAATFTPNAHTLLMNQGDQLRITIKDTPSGLFTGIEDLTTGATGFMVASAKHSFQSLDPNSCAPTNFSFHPEYATAKFGNFVPWAALEANVNFSAELGHFTPGVNGDHDADDPPCFPGPTVAGCIGADTDFDGTSYLLDWPDGTTNNATSLSITSVLGSGIGPLSVSSNGTYDQPYPQIQFETVVGASEKSCHPNGVGCVVPPRPAQFYPFYSLSTSNGCVLQFGNLSGAGFNNFGGDAQYGVPTARFFGTNSGGIENNPCLP